MKTLYKVLFVSFFLLSMIYAQQAPDYVGLHSISRQLNGVTEQGCITIPEIYNPSLVSASGDTYYNDLFMGTIVRWNYQDPVSIGDRCAVSGNGLYGAVGWGLNNTRISFYENNNSTPVWEYPVFNNGQVNYVSLNYNGDLIAAGANQNIYVFNNSSNVPIFNFDLTTLGGVPSAGPVAIAQNENFLIGTSSMTDSSIILGFNTSSTNPVWSITVTDPLGANYGNIQGLRLSGNDSLLIINTYGEFWVIETFTGNILFEGAINPISSTSGTQANQGISYDGSVIATINYFGYVRVFGWDGATYNLLWQDQEPPGTYYNWASAVDVSNDGDYIAVGTLIFVSSTQANGTVKFYKTSGGGTPAWIYNNCGDEVTSVSFNGPANVLAAASWGAFGNSTPDLYIFKTWEGNVPIFTVNTAGSFFDGKISLDGSTLLTSGKAVHAREFGNGGLVYNIAVDTSDTNVPVELSSFTANVSGGNVVLNWTTATETNNRGFEVQKSSGGEYQTIGFVQGSGTTTQQHSYTYSDKNVENGNYSYRLRQVDFDGTSDYSQVVEVNITNPVEFSLAQNYPNPFNPSTKINYSLKVDSKVTLKVFDILGQEVVTLLNENIAAGSHNVTFDASRLNSGVYLYKIEANGVDGSSFSSVKKMILTK